MENPMTYIIIAAILIIGITLLWSKFERKKEIEELFSDKYLIFQKEKNEFEIY